MTPSLLMFLNKWISKQQKLQLSPQPPKQPVEMLKKSNILPSLIRKATLSPPLWCWALCSQGFIIQPCMLAWLFLRGNKLQQLPFQPTIASTPNRLLRPHIIYLGSHIARYEGDISRILGRRRTRDLCTRARALPLCTRLIKPLAPPFPPPFPPSPLS